MLLQGFEVVADFAQESGKFFRQLEEGWGLSFGLESLAVLTQVNEVFLSRRVWISQLKPPDFLELLLGQRVVEIAK